MVIDLEAQITVSAILDDRKRFVFRPFEEISARFGGNVSALQTTQSSPALPMSAEFSIVFTLKRVFLALPSSDLLIFRHFRRRWPTERVSCWLRPDARPMRFFESGGAAFGS